MSRSPQVIEAPRNRRAEAPAGHAPPTNLARAVWRVHASGGESEIATTVLAGADLNWLERSGSSRLQADRRPPALVLTFWCEATSSGDAARRILAEFASDPGVSTAGHTSQVASFEIIEAPLGLSVEVRCGGPVLRIAQWKSPGAAAPIAWCQSIAHSLLGLAGGQYRLAEATIAAPVALRLARRGRRSREAV